MRTLIALGAVLLASTSAQAAVNLVVNGSFENGVSPAGSTFLASEDVTSITGWRVLSEGVNYVDSSVWAASTGDRSVELGTNLGAGGVWQRVSGFTVGSRYRLTFDVSANPFDPAARPKPSRVLTSVTGGLAEIYSYTLTDANTSSSMLYDTISYDFIAGNNFQNIQFRSLLSAGENYGAVIDNVSISVVPEASTWAMMIVGFSLVGFASRRRNRGFVVA
ncbi:DUF642 domain-containing protein [Polymorphobacter fuscus]|uniref:DUF642 domain-containing protein n=1 Tax=Sandarakinorhabdus fusca TaxID=1439888 RepID=A0A7C9GQ76_9SPHN|nr:DUF642 domain-containing protein [Polymorphobacter fuscus]KAB7644908.1 DUF642 domain-containing protein [Polymorphobacter fuscus]MQT18192.1 DUF642 domain-containing protein [Polymorphobacter fuscus]NJC09512.1 hypothetical protein [Polymorphobacter fuscus]